MAKFYCSIRRFNSVLLCALAICFFSNAVQAQITFQNPSFEDTPGQASTAPASWNVCGGNSTPDIQPNAFSVAVPPSDGNSYIGFVVRGNGTNEGLSQALSDPLDSNKCYQFTIDLAMSPDYAGSTNYGNPTAIRCWGGFSDCDTKELLWTSPVVGHNDWQTYTVNFKPEDNYTHFLFESAHDPAASSPYLGNILLDNLTNIVELDAPTITVSGGGEICEGDDPLELTIALEGEAPWNFTYQDASGTVSETNYNSNELKLTVGENASVSVLTVSDKNCVGNVLNPTEEVKVNQLPELTVGTVSDQCSEDASFSLGYVTPAGGTYAGSAVSVGGEFDPSTASIGSNTITYDYTDGKGCENSTTFDITVHQNPSLTVTPLDAVCSEADKFLLSNVSPVGGDYGGTGVSNDEFDPSVASIGSNALTYVYTDGNGCSKSATFNIEVNENPTLTVDSVPDQCESAIAFALDNVTPTGGNYGGTGVDATNNFDPSVAGSGNHTLNYEFTDANGCKSESNFTVKVDPKIDFVVSPVGPFCADAGTQVLSNVSPVGGTYSGTGVTSGNFEVSADLVGTNTINYALTRGACKADVDFDVEVNALPVISLGAFPELCENGVSEDLSAMLTPSGGLLSGMGVSGNSFDPTIVGAGNHVLNYAYTDGNGCAANEDFTMVVHAKPVVQTSNLIFCELDGAEVLNHGLPSGGKYSGIGVDATNNFDPSVAGSGNHSLNYAFTDANGCKSESNFSVKVDPKIDFVVSPVGPFCADAGTQVLSNVSPVGGTYSGTGVTSGNFAVSTDLVGTNTINYALTRGACSADVDFDIEVNALPVISLGAFPELCENGASEDLSAMLIPSGGLLSGTGVSGNSFDPTKVGAGNHELNYAYTDGNGCASDEDFTLIVHSKPVVQASDLTYCELDGAEVLNHGIPAGGTYSGVAVSADNSFDPSVAGQGNYVLTYAYEDLNGCQEQANFQVEVVGKITPFVALKSPKGECEGKTIHFQLDEASLVGDFPSSTFSWYLERNGSNQLLQAGSNAKTWSSNSLQNGDALYVELDVPSNCATTNSVTSDKETATVYSLVNPSILASDTVICFDNPEDVILQATDLNGNTIQTWIWTYDAIQDDTSGSELTVSNPGTYQVQGISVYGCQGPAVSTSIQTIKVNVAITVEDAAWYSGDYVLEIGDEAMLKAKHKINEVYDSYLWTDVTGSIASEQNISVAPVQSTFYAVTATKAGCSASDTVNFQVLGSLAIAPVLTPDGNGENDYWVVEGLETMLRTHIQVYNKYGNLVFETRDYLSEPWYGQNQRTGNDLPEGVYYYLIVPSVPEELEENEKYKPVSGHVTLLR